MPRYEHNKAYCDKFYEAVAEGIKPLVLRERNSYTHRLIEDPDTGERLGSISQCFGSGWSRSSDKFRLESPRIPSRSRYSDGFRVIEKPESMIKKIKEFCYAETDLEKAAEEAADARNSAALRIDKTEQRGRRLINRAGFTTADDVLRAMAEYDHNGCDPYGGIEIFGRALLWERVAKRMKPVLEQWYQFYIDEDVRAACALRDEREKRKQQ